MRKKKMIEQKHPAEFKVEEGEKGGLTQQFVSATRQTLPCWVASLSASLLFRVRPFLTLTCRFCSVPESN